MNENDIMKKIKDQYRVSMKDLNDILIKVEKKLKGKEITAKNVTWAIDKVEEEQQKQFLKNNRQAKIDFLKFIS